MTGEPLLEFDAVSKKYCKSARRALRYGVADVARAAVGARSGSARLRAEEFWAVRDLSFRLGAGGVLGVIGPNGSGKSTLIKMAAGILPPDTGRITIRGDLGALVEVGAGFHPEMTGRENVHLYGAILGMSRSEVAAKFDAIVEFAEIGDYLDMPVKRYSSGMYVRLGFAVAIHREPDVLLVDEVLAVGDVAFRAKCYQEIARIAARGCVVFVSHSMAAVSRICDSVIVLDRGLPTHFRDVPAGVEAYMALSRAGGRSERLDFGVAIDGVGLRGAAPGGAVRRGQRLTVEAELDCHEAQRRPVIDLSILDRSQQYVFQTNSGMDRVDLPPLAAGRHRLLVELPEVQLATGAYSLSLAVLDGDTQRHLGWAFNVAPFSVQGGFRGVAAYQAEARWALEALAGPASASAGREEIPNP